jgi:2-haloacid dehalogenase
MQTQHTGVVFDLGGVLIDWNPRHLYGKLFPGDQPGMERFLTEICSPAWNLEQDRGRSWAEATALLCARHPQHKDLIEAYRGRWHEMLGGPIEGTVDILRDLKGAGVPLFGLTNWSHETFPEALKLYDFLGWFQAIIVSGQERMVKPDPRIYRLLNERHGLDLISLVYIDDNPANAEAATRLGMHGIHFTDPATLRTELVGLKLLRS